MTSTSSPEAASVVAYTCSLGDVDDVEAMLRCLPQQRNNLRFVMFTDRNIGQLSRSAPNWTILPARTQFDIAGASPYDWSEVSPQRLARMHKLLPHCLPFAGESDVSIWFDGNIIPCDGVLLTELCEYVSGEREMAVFRHPERQTVKQEVEACIRLRKDRPETMLAQFDEYISTGFPDDAGLAETGVIVRRNCRSIRKFNEAWAVHVLTRSVRDQISFPFVAWQLGQPWAQLAGRGVKNPWFTYRRHSKSLQVPPLRRTSPSDDSLN